jgi:hypothetical protein
VTETNSVAEFKRLNNEGVEALRSLEDFGLLDVDSERGKIHGELLYLWIKRN